MWERLNLLMVLFFCAGIYLIFLSETTCGMNRRLIYSVNMENKRSKLLKWKDMVIEDFRKWQGKKINRAKDEEVYEAISFLRNIIAIDRGKQVSTDFIIEELSRKPGFLQNTYIRMLSFLRVNKRAEAQRVMAESLETTIGKEFAGLLLKWDEINPSELTEILLSHQKSIKEIRMTYQKRRDETISDVLYFPIIINVVIIFMNFIYVGYFINQKQILQMLF